MSEIIENEEIKWIEVIHRDCGKPALLCKDKDYHNGDMVQAEDFKHLDGKQCLAREAFRCDSCSAGINLTLLNNRPIAYNAD